MSKDTEHKEATRIPVFKPATDIVELEDGFHLFLDMPGVSKESLDIDLKDKELIINGLSSFSPRPEEEEGNHFSHVEFSGGRYVRSFTLSDNVDRAGITANFENGVLNVHLPKSESVLPRKISIQQG